MTWLWPEDSQWQDTHEMDSNWEGEKVRSKNYPVKNSDERAGEDGSNMGWITGQSSGWESSGNVWSYVPVGIKTLCEWVSLAERKKKKENLQFSIIFCLDNEQNAIEYNFWLQHWRSLCTDHFKLAFNIS